MEIIIFLLILGVIFFIGLPILAAFIGFGMFTSGENQRKKDESNADAILDRVFDGSPTVVHTPRDSKLGYDVLVKGAAARGYKLSHSEGHEIARTHVFDRIDD
ncbi:MULTISPECIES: hypothetical protein [unclassified Brevibacterium]|uniref:hypothetical protein n=1 Tax=unclassified Brevibacterium TaxID=2614124 RepID=UPI001E48E9DF|nr:MULTISPECIES: hypothetical protein [unclassified Brevibacterium]MCD1287289.1 hypothetical protein [Brevibacterium sp. CCUG 69071]MDK8436457.1 hypothetical protein [Brevibacterium sp. H-BE7]